MRSLIFSPLDYHDSHLPTIGEQWQHRLLVQPDNLWFLVFFAAALVHLFGAHRFNRLALAREQAKLSASGMAGSSAQHRGAYRTFGAELLSFLSEVEIIIGFWCVPALALIAYRFGWQQMLSFVNHENYTDALFIVVAVAMALTKPCMDFFERLIGAPARRRGGRPSAWWLSIMTMGVLLGSFIKETVAMSICATLLARHFYRYRPSLTLAYATMALLLVNISIGGMLTKVGTSANTLIAERWGWSNAFMFQTFGWRALLALTAAAGLVRLLWHRHFAAIDDAYSAAAASPDAPATSPWWITLIHLALLGWLIFNHDNTVIALGSFVFFMGFHQATAPYQSNMELREPILVGFFVASLIILGSLQTWWIAPIFDHLNDVGVMKAALALSALKPNALLTLIAAKVPDLDDLKKYYLYTGAMAGGGLTIIANAPNLIAYNLLAPLFPKDISLLTLTLTAIPITLLVVLFFLF